ncbi:MAG: hypothetical protein P9L92_15065 [Candidatus Electryonea clarkiae]|nr:hypothetical protein [Candidatus Electryonea clarkiae]MDP8288962.1 hypothetical protein [Candidatus Electryonea clarkiae]
MNRRKKRWKPGKETRRWIILVVSAIILAGAAAFISRLLDQPVESYYPHDDARAVRQPETEYK